MVKTTVVLFIAQFTTKDNNYFDLSSIFFESVFPASLHRAF
jgi:hypothetical protein